MATPTRRQLLVGGAAAGGGAVGAVAAVRALRSGESVGAIAPAVTPASTTVPFHGTHQAGVATPAQTHAAFIGLDLRAEVGRDALVRLLRLLTDDGARLTAGRPALGDTEPELAASPARLTVTIGFGPGLFARFGLQSLTPASVRPLPTFPGDRLDQRWGQTDLLLQVCTDDPTVLAHTVRMLVKDARAFATIRFDQRGFRSGDAAGATAAGTPRNLMGQVDGTVNPAAGTPDFAPVVWAGGSPAWFEGGTVLVLRRIRMDLEAWDAFDPGGRDVVLGRRADGSPLSGTTETDVPDLRVVDAQGFTVIDPNAHIRLAHATAPAERMLRRGYNYDAGCDPQGRPDVGLLFAAYQADADRAFVAVQQRLADHDLLNRWVTHVGSGIYAIPPGVEAGGYVGQALLEAAP